VQYKGIWLAGYLVIWILAAPLNGQDAWERIFNGKDMSGWEHVGPGHFTVNNGMLRTHGGMGLLWYTNKPIGNAVLRVVFKTSNPGNNSGVFIRIDGKPTDQWHGVHRGYEIQIFNEGDPWHTTGAIYSISKVVKNAYNPTGEWNVLEITLDGPKTIVHLNSQKVNEYTEGSPVPERKHDYEPIRGRRPNLGYIGLQNHDKETSVFFKEVSIRPLN